MKTWFVTRHPGAVQWAREAGIEVLAHDIVNNLDPLQVGAGDQVVGTLPVNIVAEVIRRGATYCHLALELPIEARGKELTPEEMRRYGARLEKYHVESIGSPQSRTDLDGRGRRVMLAIASGQSLPNLLPLLALEPPVSHLFLAVSADERAKVSAEKIKRVARLVKLPVTVFDNVPAAPLSTVEQAAQGYFAGIRKKIPDARIILNASGGTKMMSSGFTNALGPAGEVVYCDTDNDCVEYFMPQGRPALPLPNDLTSLEIYLLAQGQEITQCASADPVWMARAQARSELTRTLAAMLDGYDAKNIEHAERYVGELNRMAYAALPRSDNGKIINIWTPDQQERNKHRCSAMIEKHGLWTRSDEKNICFSSEEAAKYLSGGWLEEYAALTMQSLGVNPAQWGVGVKIRPIDSITGKTAKHDEKDGMNELDLAVVWRNRLLIIECKTGTQLSKGKDSQEILNKIEAIKNYAAGTFGTAWLLSARSVGQESAAAKRAREYKIRIFEREAIATLGQRIAQWMKLPMEAESIRLLQENDAKCDLRNQRREQAAR